jgi:hypothetical protein
VTRASLRSAGTWAFLGLAHIRLRTAFSTSCTATQRLPTRTACSGRCPKCRSKAPLTPVGQLPQWVFAFDAAGMAALRAAALSATHPEARSRGETAEPDRLDLRPFLRVCVLESVRLWPTTPTLLRDTAGPTVWRDGHDTFTVESGTAVMIVVSFPPFTAIRNCYLSPTASRPTSGWSAVRSDIRNWCRSAQAPSRALAEIWCFITSSVLAHLFSAAQLELQSTPRPDPAQPLPATFEPADARLPNDTVPVAATR